MICTKKILYKVEKIGKKLIFIIEFIFSFQEVTRETEFTVTAKPSDAAIVINTCPKEENEKVLTVIITLTSTVIREEIMAISENKPLKEEPNNDVTAAGGESRARFITRKMLRSCSLWCSCKWFMSY